MSAIIFPFPRTPAGRDLLHRCLWLFDGGELVFGRRAHEWDWDASAEFGEQLTREYEASLRENERRRK